MSFLSSRSFLPLILGASLLGGCSSWFYGSSNEPEPVDLPEMTQSVSTEILWRKNLGDGGEEANLALAPDSDGRSVYAISANGRFYKLDAQTGEEQFDVRIGREITGGVRYAGDMVLAGAANGDLMALSSSDGRVLWNSPLGSQLLSVPALGENMIVVKTDDGAITALDPQDGTSLWRYQGSEPLMTIRGSGAPVVGGGVVIATSSNGYFTVLDQATGLPMVNTRIAMGSSGNPMANLVDQNATPVINNAQLFAAAYQSMVYAVDLQAGQPLWENNQVSTLNQLALSPTALYVTESDGTVSALNQADGTIAWQNKELLGRRLSPPLAIPGRVGVVDYEGYLIWLDSETGRLLGNHEIGDTHALSSPLVLDSVILWQLADGRLVALRPQ